MMLFNRKTNQPIIEFKEGQTIFHNKFLEGEMRSIGIPIPHGLRGIYHGKNTVCLDDEEFQKAFKEIYYLTAMDSEMFEWRE